MTRRRGMRSPQTRTAPLLLHQDSPAQYHVAQTLETPESSRSMGLDRTNHCMLAVSGKFGPAPAGARGRPPVLPGSFRLMVIEREPAAR